jgi:osmotically inducible protein OsmC
MATRNARAVWQGDLKSGHGTMTLGDKGTELSYGFASRFEDGAGSNPEELIGAAHAGCFSMALAHLLAEQGHSPQQIRTSARVELRATNGDFQIPAISLETEAEVPDIENAAFQKIAESAKENCPVSKLLKAKITLQATLVGSSNS